MFMDPTVAARVIGTWVDRASPFKVHSPFGLSVNVRAMRPICQLITPQPLDTFVRRNEQGERDTQHIAEIKLRMDGGLCTKAVRSCVCCTCG